jgi:integrase
VERRISTICAVFNYGVRELDLKGITNPFEKLPIVDMREDARERLPFDVPELHVIASACHRLDDDIRHIIGLQRDTGARLGEIVGLRRDDVFVEDAIPYLWIRPHKAFGRTLKTPGSERKIPLVGESHWAATAALKASKGPWLFQRYIDRAPKAGAPVIKGNHASATINKWLRESLDIEKSTHSFRHAMQDRLRAAGVPRDVREQLLGHGSRSVGDGYGQGFSLEVLMDAMSKVVIS